jgi:hypothetical protein
MKPHEIPADETVTVETLRMGETRYVCRGMIQAGTFARRSDVVATGPVRETRDLARHDEELIRKAMLAALAAMRASAT